MINLLNKEHRAFQGLAHWMYWIKSQLPKNLSVQYPVGKKKQALETLERKILECKNLFPSS